LRSSNTQFNIKALGSNSGSVPFVDDGLLQESKEHALGWYLLEKRKRIPKDSVSSEEAATFHGENFHRITLGSIINLTTRAKSTPVQAARP
jgi:hypothetical protein